MVLGIKQMMNYTTLVEQCCRLEDRQDWWPEGAQADPHVALLDMWQMLKGEVVLVSKTCHREKKLIWQVCYSSHATFGSSMKGSSWGEGRINDGSISRGRNTRSILHCYIILHNHTPTVCLDINLETLFKKNSTNIRQVNASFNV